MAMQVTMRNKGLSQVTHFYLREIMSHVSHSALCDLTQRDKKKKLSHRHHYGKSYLTPREFDCIKLLLENKKIKEIAFDLIKFAFSSTADLVDAVQSRVDTT